MVKAAVFLDLDNTICRHNTGEVFASHLLKHNQIAFRRLFPVYLAFCLYYLKMINDINGLRNKLFYALFKDKSYDTMIKLYHDCFNQRLLQYINNDVYLILIRHKAMNRDIWIVSASLDFFVKPFAEYLQINKYLASSAEVKNGKFTGKLLNDIYQNKQVAIEDLSTNHGYDLDLCYAYSDSISDKDMLSCVGHPIAVNPDNKLRKLAIQQKWIIEEWR